MQDERTVGSALIGQNVGDVRYFHGRPLRRLIAPYNALATGGSNLAVSNPLLQQAMIERVKQLRANPRCE